MEEISNVRFCQIARIVGWNSATNTSSRLFSVVCRDESWLCIVTEETEEMYNLPSLCGVLIGKGQRKELDLRVWKLCLSSVLTPKLQYMFKKGNQCSQNNHYDWFRNSGFINYPQTGCKNCSCSTLCRFHLDTVVFLEH